MMGITRTTLLGAAGTLVALAGTLVAQQPGQKGGPEHRGSETRMMVGHGLLMVIDGSGLRGAAEELSQGQPNPGQPQPAKEGQKEAQKGAQESNPARLLMMHARREIQEGQRLMREAEAEAAHDASCQRLFNAAGRYAETLCVCCGESCEKDSSAEQGKTGANQARASLNAQDKAAVCLINHAVKSAVIGTAMSRGLQHMGGQSEAHQQLQKHAQEMATEGRDLLDRFISSKQQPAGTAGGPQAQKGSPVMMLAVQGREVIEAWNATSNQGQNEGPKQATHASGD